MDTQRGRADANSGKLLWQLRMKIGLVFPKMAHIEIIVELETRYFASFASHPKRASDVRCGMSY